MLKKILAVVSCSLTFFGPSIVGFGYDVIPVSNGATIVGKVVFIGVPPAPRVFDVNKEPEVCGKVRSLEKIQVENGFLKGAIIFLEGVKKGKAFEAKTFKAILPGEGKFLYKSGKTLDLDVSQKKCNFGPVTGVIAKGQPIEFENQDPIKHTLHTYVLRGKNANILRTINTQNLSAHSKMTQALSSKKLKQARVVAFTCDRHDFMENWMYVVDSPYFAISGVRGQFFLDQVPPGQYELVAWHPELGTQRRTVNVSADSSLDVSFEFRQ